MTLDEETATRIVERAVEEAGGKRRIHGNPRHPFALNPTREVDVDGHTIAELEGYIFEIRADELLLLFGP
jgi:hypothetical protein